MSAARQKPRSEFGRRSGALRMLVPVLAAFVCALVLPHFAQAAEWPVIELPSQVRGFDGGQQVHLNGLPMRLRGFVSALSTKAAADAFRQSLGKPLVENVLGDKLVLGRVQGEHYISVQIEPAGSGSRGVVGVTHLQNTDGAQAATQANAQRWLSRLPAGSRLLSQMESQDGGKLSRHLVITNAVGELLNRERLISLLADEGLVFERGDAAAASGDLQRPAEHAGSRLLFFKGAGKEALATLHRDDSGQTTMVLNVVTSLERVR